MSTETASRPAASTNVVVGGGDTIGPIEWLEVTRKMHACRHNGTNCQ